MIPDGYRILVKYDGDKEQFIATVPELGQLKASGETRAEALAGAEAEVEKAFRKAAEEGREMPSPMESTEFSGELAIKVSPALHRELVFLAKADEIEIEQLLTEIISAGCAIRSSIRNRPRPNDTQTREGRGRRDNRRDGRRQGRGGKGYFNIMDDKASFMEYVRGLEGGGGRGGRRGGGGRGRGRKS